VSWLACEEYNMYLTVSAVLVLCYDIWTSRHGIIALKHVLNAACLFN
jgi:hypothetical protein